MERFEVQEVLISWAFVEIPDAAELAPRRPHTAIAHSVSCEFFWTQDRVAGTTCTRFIKRER
jgi:hypothetical protein